MAQYTFWNSTAKQAKHSGVYGNTATWDCLLAVGGASGITSTTGDTVTINLMKLPAGAIVHEIAWLIGAAYNAGSSIALGFVNVDPNQPSPANSVQPAVNAFTGGSPINGAATGSGTILVMPMHFAVPAWVQATFSGATGEQVKKTLASLYIRMLGVSDGA